jgi:hypothetical protein
MSIIADQVSDHRISLGGHVVISRRILLFKKVEIREKIKKSMFTEIIKET